VALTISNFMHFVLSVVKGVHRQGETNMYILQDKHQLHSFVKSIHNQMNESFRCAPKISKLKEIVARCLKCNSYAAVVSTLPINMEEFDYTFPRELARKLSAAPYGIARGNEDSYIEIYYKAISTNSYFDEVGFNNGIDLATMPM
jgi:hypothetical protein